MGVCSQKMIYTMFTVMRLLGKTFFSSVLLVSVYKSRSFIEPPRSKSPFLSSSNKHALRFALVLSLLLTFFTQSFIVKRIQTVSCSFGQFSLLLKRTIHVPPEPINTWFVFSCVEYAHLCP